MGNLLCNRTLTCGYTHQSPLIFGTHVEPWECRGLANFQDRREAVLGVKAAHGQEGP